jgi:ubiquitin-protein ligase
MSDASPTSGGAGTSRTLRRIYKELAEIRGDPSPDWTAYPVNEEEPYEWHFSVRGPSDTEFADGIYHGRFTLPYNYPFSPPTIYLLTPNGRFEVNKKICLSISSWHPELWQPAWGLRTMIEGLRSLFPTASEGAVGGLDWPASTRRELAKKSINWTCVSCGRANADLLKPEVAGEEEKESEGGVEIEEESGEKEEKSGTSEEEVMIGERRLWLEIAGIFFPTSLRQFPLFVLDVSFVATVLFVLWLISDILTNPPKK